MRDPSHFQAAGALAERKAVALRVALRTQPHTPTERDDLELQATILEAAAFDLLNRGPRPGPVSPVEKATPKRTAQARKPPVDEWREELRFVEERLLTADGSVSKRDLQNRQIVLSKALGAVEEREQIIARLLEDDARLLVLNTIVGRVRSTAVTEMFTGVSE